MRRREGGEGREREGGREAHLDEPRLVQHLDPVLQAHEQALRGVLSRWHVGDAAVLPKQSHDVALVLRQHLLDIKLVHALPKFIAIMFHLPPQPPQLGEHPKASTASGGIAYLAVLSQMIVSQQRDGVCNGRGGAACARARGEPASCEQYRNGQELGSLQRPGSGVDFSTARQRISTLCIKGSSRSHHVRDECTGARWLPSWQCPAGWWR